MVYRGSGAARERLEGHSALFLSAFHLPLGRRCRGDKKQLVGKLSRIPDDQPAWLGETLQGYGVQHWHFRPLLLTGGGGSLGRGGRFFQFLLCFSWSRRRRKRQERSFRAELLQPGCLGSSCPVWQRQVSGGDGLLAPFCWIALLLIYFNLLSNLKHLYVNFELSDIEKKLVR